MPPVVDNNQYELVVETTPSKKRKRNGEFIAFADQTFSIPSSTPINNKPIDGSAFENPSFRYNMQDSCMEIKSIADLVNEKSSVIGENPFEVIRKPPKKKKKHEFEESCFINPGLNLKAKDKTVINPFEVRRECESDKENNNERGFVNSALNIKMTDKGEKINPFEIVRSPKRELGGIENPCLEMPTFAIAVPFTPSTKMRINFEELPSNAITPCELLSKNLVFTPEPVKANLVSLTTPKRNMALTKRKSLSVISEEAIDIGEELDCYQLELENSINEAKARKQQTVITDSVKRRSTRRSLMEIKHISNLSQKLKQLEETGVDEDAENEKTEILAVPLKEDEPQNQLTFTIIKEDSEGKSEEKEEDLNPDVQYEEIDDLEEDEDFLKNPTPFQRAYRRTNHNAPQVISVDFKEPTAISKPTKVKDAIRKSFKKLISKQDEHENKENKAEQHGFMSTIRQSLKFHHKSEEKINHKENHQHHGLISTIRHSLKRKDRQHHQLKEEKTESNLEISIIGDEPRKVYRENIDDQPVAPIFAQNNNPTTFIRSSLRRSTKDAKKQVKTILKKAAEV